MMDFCGELFGCLFRNWVCVDVCDVLFVVFVDYYVCCENYVGFGC